MAALEFMVFVVMPLGLAACMLFALWLVGSATHGFMGHVHDLRQYLRWTHGGLCRLERRLAELERRVPGAAPPEAPPPDAVTSPSPVEPVPAWHLEEEWVRPTSATHPACTYARLLTQQHDLIARGEGDGPEAQDLAERMDKAWHALTELEQQGMRRLSADLYALED